MPDDPQAIAARLSPAQRRALLWLPVDGTARERSGGSDCPSLADIYPILRTRGMRPPLMTPVVAYMFYKLTPLGLAVRAILAKEPAHDRA